jgi:hypothetical protein
MAAVTTLVRAQSLVKSMVVACSIPSMALRQCSQVAEHRGLLARWQARRGVESLVVRRRSARRGLMLAVPLDKPAVVWGGAPLLDGVPRSTQ